MQALSMSCMWACPRPVLASKAMGTRRGAVGRGAVGQCPSGWDAHLGLCLKSPTRREGCVYMVAACGGDNEEAPRRLGCDAEGGPASLPGTGLSRRWLSIGLVSLPAFSAAPSKAGEALTRFTSSKLKYTLERPESWEEVEKAGANLLFRDPEAKRNTIGVVVNPVKVASLEAFGSLDEVGAKLVGAEKAKDSTNACDLLSKSARTSSTGVTIYDYDYVLDTTRGVKRILSSVAIAGQQLYILNVTLKITKDMPEEEQVPDSVRGVLASFDVFV